jgi:NAD+ kinase
MKVAVYGQNYAKEATQKAFEILVKVLLNHEIDIYTEVDFLKQRE